MSVSAKTTCRQCGKPHDGAPEERCVCNTQPGWLSRWARKPVEQPAVVEESVETEQVEGLQEVAPATEPVAEANSTSEGAVAVEAVCEALTKEVIDPVSDIAVEPVAESAVEPATVTVTDTTEVVVEIPVDAEPHS